MGSPCPVIFGGVRYPSMLAAAKANPGTSAQGMEKALKRGQKKYKGIPISWAPEIAESKKAQAEARKKNVIDEWYARHKFDRVEIRRRKERTPGERLLRPHMLGLGEAKG